ncbi:hypothetical protein IAT40_006789 [Kwoniella sp. CBS 6097]
MAYSFLLLAALAALVARSVAAQQYGSGFIGCIPVANQPTGFGLSQGDSTQDAAGCNFFCSNNGRAYSFFTPSYAGPGKYSRQGAPACTCSNTEPDPNTITNTVSAAQDTTCVTASDYQVYKSRTTEQFQGCATSDSYDHNDVYSTLEGCLVACASSPYTFAAPFEDGWECLCGLTMGSPTYSQCGYRNYVTYYHDAIAQASQLTRRKLRERLSENNRQVADCPTGLTACMIAGYSDSYECIDTNAEVESCGGCLNGVFGKTNATSGSDCTALNGVALGAVTCSAGRCESFACEDGFSLVSGKCVAV